MCSLYRMCIECVLSIECITLRHGAVQRSCGVSPRIWTGLPITHRLCLGKLELTVSKETYYSVKRDLLQCQKRPITVSKETWGSWSLTIRTRCTRPNISLSLFLSLFLSRLSLSPPPSRRHTKLCVL